MSNSGGGQFNTDGTLAGNSNGGGLPDLGQLREALAREGIFPGQQGDPEPNPESFMIALAMMAGSYEYRVPVNTISGIQQGLEAGEFVFHYRKVSALESQSGQPEWSILVAPREALAQQVSSGPGQNLPPGMPPQDIVPDTLEVKAQGTGEKYEYTWEELSKLPDEALLELGTSREEVQSRINDQMPSQTYEVSPGAFMEVDEDAKAISEIYEGDGPDYGKSGATLEKPTPSGPKVYREETPLGHTPGQSAADYAGKPGVEVDPEQYSGD